jgi:hypothetical protein
MDRESAIAELRGLIRRLLRKESDFSAFEEAYVDFFADKNADEQFTDADHKLYGDLFERLQWTSRHPTGLDRADGYHSRAETEEWIRTRFADIV